uniref:C-type lectin domain-containing protein n=1 Tax=Denticeps clupeoides TaxID=299321 RepID=A0AAY4DY81_9TELE
MIMMDNDIYGNTTTSDQKMTTASQHPGAKQGEGIRRYRRAAVCLGLLGLVLLGIAAGLCVKYRTEILDKYMLEAKVTQLEKQFQEFNYRIFQSATEDVWNMSRKYCREKGGDLVMIKSKEKQTVLYEMRLNGWIGLSDESEEGKWTWVDTTTAHTTFWGKGQPDNWASVDEDCAVFHSKDDNPLSTWHDHKCLSKHLAICEKS